jgi:hypothetical protein
MWAFHHGDPGQSPRAGTEDTENERDLEGDPRFTSGNAIERQADVAQWQRSGLLSWGLEVQVLPSALLGIRRWVLGAGCWVLGVGCWVLVWD